MTSRVIKLRRASDTSQEPGVQAPATLRRGVAGRAHLIAFLGLAILPALLAAIYLFGFASDQYVAEFRFNLRRGSDAIISPSTANGMPGIPSFGGVGLTATQVWDSQAIVQFISSRDIVDALEEQIGFDRLYRPSGVDGLSRLKQDASIERKTEYWRSMVEPFFDLQTGVISVSVRAFNAADALAVANAVLQRSEKMVNDLSLRSRQDAINFGEEEVAKAERALTAARATLRDFRDKADVLDPVRSADIDINLQAHQRERLSTLQSQYASLLKSAPNSPQLIYLAYEKSALEAIIEEQQSKLTRGRRAATGDNPTISSVLGSFEALKLEEVFREKLYLFALQFAEQSRIEAMKQQLYLNAFVRPKLPQEALYPRRLHQVALVFFAGLAIWGLGALAFYSVRDHL